MKNRIDRRTMLRMLGAGACGAGLAPILSGCESGLIDPNGFAPVQSVFGYPLSQHSFGDNEANSVVCMGDSVTRGQFVTGRLNYPARLRSLLKTTHLVANEGVNGQTTYEAADRIDQLLRQYTPGFLLILYGVNDIIACDDAGFCNYAPLVANMAYILETAKANLTIPILATVTPSNWGIQRNIDAFNVLLREMAAEQSVKVVDLAAEMGAMIDSGTDLEDLFYDGVHASNTGAVVIADLFLAGINSFSE